MNTQERNMRAVRALWAASRRGGTDEALALLDPDAEWRLHIYPDRILTTAELEDTLHRLERERHVTSAELHQVEARGDYVVAAGSFRWTGDDGGVVDFRGYWVYQCRGGRIVRGDSFPDWTGALDCFNRHISESSL